MKNTLLLPAQINPPTFRKDRSVTLKFETRELTPEEFQVIMAFQGTEGWVAFSQNKEEAIQVPEEDAELGLKTSSERLLNALYVLWKHESKTTFTGTFESYYKGKMEKYIEHTLSKVPK